MAPAANGFFGGNFISRGNRFLEILGESDLGEISSAGNLGEITLGDFYLMLKIKEKWVRGNIVENFP